jgi:hypothetical protein
MYHQYLLCLNKRKLNLETLANRGDELYNVALNAAYWQIYVTYVLFVF